MKMHRLGLKSRKNDLPNFEHVELKIAKEPQSNYTQDECGYHSEITLNLRRCGLRTYVSI